MNATPLPAQPSGNRRSETTRSTAGAVLSVGRSSMVRICLDVYLAHRSDRSGRCDGCGALSVPCLRRRRASLVLKVAGIDPASVEVASTWAE